ncbi:MAG: trimeric intracellular cation channel family protein [Muribaculaceae bacterium]|nr:trimeric intracellular cation channel family protein [Muribaculaceae bacterium]
MSTDLFLLIIEVIGTIAFAISGIRLAVAKNFDWFGAYIVGLITAIGGGTIRDVLLDVPPFWMLNSLYLSVTAASLVFVALFRKYLVRIENTLFIWDTIGLGLFVVIGIHKTLQCGYPFWVATIMGTLTGAFGGVLRDILINEVPLIFRREVYAMACVVGGIVYWACMHQGMPEALQQIMSAVSVILIRFLAVAYDISLPSLTEPWFKKKEEE